MKHHARTAMPPGTQTSYLHILVEHRISLRHSRHATQRCLKRSHEANHGNLGCLLHHNVRRIEHGQQLLGGSGCSTERRFELDNLEDGVQCGCSTLPLTDRQRLSSFLQALTCLSADDRTVMPWASSVSGKTGSLCAEQPVGSSCHLPRPW